MQPEDGVRREWGITEGKVIPFPIDPDRIVLLLSFYLDSVFRDVLTKIGFSVLWADSYEGTEMLLMRHRPDMAIEWQRHPRDFPLLDLVNKYWKEVPVFLCLNYTGKRPPDFEELGYADSLNMPWTLQELFDKVHPFLCLRKRRLLAELRAKRRGNDAKE